MRSVDGAPLDGRDEGLGRGRTHERDAEAVGEALGRRDPDPQSGERARAGPDDDAAKRDRRMFCSPRNRPIEGSSVSPCR